MKTTQGVLTHLNTVLKYELTNINQLFMHSRICQHWGLNMLAQKNYKASIQSMKMADTLMQRILFLEGLPNLQHIDKLFIGENVEEIMDSDLRLARDGKDKYQQAIQYCELNLDYETRFILNQGLTAAEEHIDWLETQQWLLHSLGVENYSQTQIGSEPK